MQRLIEQHHARADRLKQFSQRRFAGGNKLSIVVGHQIKGRFATQLVGHLAPQGANLHTVLCGAPQGIQAGARQYGDLTWRNPVKPSFRQ